ITDTNTDANAVDEDASVGAVVGITAFASDADGTNNGVTYSLSDDAGGLFTIDANTGVVTVASGLDAETATSHNITVVATSTDGSTSNETFTIGVNDVNETSISAISDTNTDANSVSEGASVGTAVGITALATDADVTDTVSYSLSSNPGGFFSIDANTGEVTVASALDFETNEDHTIEVTATSTDGTTSTQSFTIDVTDENEAPTDIQFETTGIREDANRNDGIGEIELNVIDPDGDTNFTFTVSDSRFEVYEDGGSYFLQVKDGVSLDHETESSIDLTVTATDQGGLSYSEDVTLDVTDVNEAPVAQTVDLGATNEDTGIVITQAQLLANSSDVDAGATLSVTDLTIQDNAHGSLTDNGNGTWTFNPTGDLSVDDVTFNFTVSDGTLTDSSTATLDVTAVADAPTLDLSTTSQDIITGSTTISSGFEGDVASIGATGNNGFVGSIGGWNTDSDAIEVKTETLADGSTNQFIELNDDALDFYEDASNIYQNIETTDGGTYTVDFNFAPRPGYDGTINNIEVLVDGVVVKTISADGTSDSSINWQSDSITFTGDGTPARIEFREAGVDQNYGRGMYMDNISITEDLPEGHANGMENTAIALPDITAATTDADGSETLALTITSIPEGAVLTDGTNTFTATAGDTDVDVTSWQLDSITMTPPEEFSGDITLTVNATATDGSSQNTTSSDISITVHDDDDTFTGTATEDLYNGGAGDDTINGNDGNDWLLGGEGDDTINGGNGDDVMAGGAGDDEINGGSGADTVTFSGNLADYSIAQSPDGSYLISDLRTDSPDGTDLISNVESFQFADQTVVVGDLTPTTTFDLNQFRTAGEGIIAFDDRSAELTDQIITGSDSNELLVGGAGNDTITAGGGDDDAAGKNGKDSISGGDGDDIILGGNGNDILSGDAGNDAIDGGKGTGDTAEYSGNITDYTVTQKDDGSLVIQDDRPGSPDGTDVVTNVENFQFADITVTAEELVADDFDVSEISDSNGSSNTVTENASIGTSVGITALATDNDASDNVTYSLSNDAGGLFTIDANTGEVTTAGDIDYETATSHTIEVTASSSDGSTSTQNYTINVEDVAGQTITGTDTTSTGGDTGSINTSNYSDTSSGYTVSAKNVVGGALTTASAANIATSGGLGANGTISDSDSGQASQLGYDKASGLSEELIVDFDNDVDSANFSFANLFSNDFGEVGHWAVYDNGTLVAEGDFTESTPSSGSGTISINPDASFDQLVITGKLQTDGTDGSDFVVTDISYNEVETITGGNDTLTGTAEDDKISGLTGDDVLTGGDGNDTIYGGSSEGGATTSNVAITNASFENASLADGSSTGDLGGWTDVNGFGETSVWDPTSSSFTTTPDGENILTIQEDNHVRQTLSESFDSDSDYELSFSVGNPMSTGTGDSWSVNIYSGNTLIGSANGTEPAANAWQDVTISIDGDAYAAADGGALRIDIQNTETYTGSGDSIAFDNFELTKTSEIDDGADTLNGGAGNDTLNGGSGNDILNGGAGQDELIGGTGADTLDGGSGYDWVQYYGSSEAVNVDLSDNLAESGGEAEGDTISNVEQIDGSNIGNDTITADNSGMQLKGWGGNDTLTGGTGNDTLVGGEGNDTLSGGDGSDLFIFQEGDGADIINGGAGSSWTDTIELQDAMGGSDLGTYGTDWTVTLTEGSIEETNSDNILFSDDADGTINLQDGSSIDFTDIERIDW
ncbi:MAG: cadherin domain-containing protein, partial [Hyphomicrobiales bacterium]